MYMIAETSYLNYLNISGSPGWEAFLSPTVFLDIIYYPGMQCLLCKSANPHDFSTRVYYVNESKPESDITSVKPNLFLQAMEPSSLCHRCKPTESLILDGGICDP